jgi:hypothetical protein
VPDPSPITMRPAKGDIIHHEDPQGRSMVYIGQIVVIGATVSVIPCRGLTAPQAVKLLNAYGTLRHQDVWAQCCDGLVTHVSMSAADTACVWVSPRVLRRIRQRTWNSTRRATPDREFYVEGGPPRTPKCLGLDWVHHDRVE